MLEAKNSKKHCLERKFSTLSFVIPLTIFVMSWYLSQSYALYNYFVISVILKITKQSIYKSCRSIWGVKFMFYNKNIKKANLLRVSKKSEKLLCKDMLSWYWSVILYCRGHKLCTESAKCQDLLCLNFSWPACSLFFSWFGCDSSFSNSLGLSGWFALLLCIFLWSHHGFTRTDKYGPGRIRETERSV